LDPNPKPRLSWKLVGDQEKRGQEQAGYQVLVASSMDNLNAGRGDLWDSGAEDGL
jgi:alpha-L-rhamnosidase